MFSSFGTLLFILYVRTGAYSTKNRSAPYGLMLPPRKWQIAWYVVLNGFCLLLLDLLIRSSKDEYLGAWESIFCNQAGLMNCALALYSDEKWRFTYVLMALCCTVYSLGPFMRYLLYKGLVASSALVVTVAQVSGIVMLLTLLLALAYTSGVEGGWCDR